MQRHNSVDLASGTRNRFCSLDEAVFWIVALLLVTIPSGALWYWMSCKRSVEAHGSFEIVGGQWRIALRMRSDDLSQLRDRANADEELDVDYLVMTAPDTTFRGKLRLKDMAVDNNNPREARGLVRIHSVNGDLPKELCVPECLLLSGVEIHARIRR